ncbi:hypothetical protein HOY82DRAFT_599352 [Tuber indicum]|nr:hypothetical protein HOY82DRAFT_599352 [Tuber indicum]
MPTPEQLKWANQVLSAVQSTSRRKTGGGALNLSSDSRVEIDFLDKAREGGSLQKCTDYSPTEGMPVATLTDLAIAKGGALIDRQNEKDIHGFKCNVKTMTEKMLNLKGLGREKCKTLDDITIVLEWMSEERGLLHTIRMRL